MSFHRSAARVAALSLACLAPAAFAQNAAVTVAIDANANRHAIDPAIYGVAYADAASLADLNAPLNRRGGNNASRYNWQQNADNRGSDWFFESLPFASASAGDDADQFVAAAKGAGSNAMITIPTIGWVARLGANRGKLSSFSVLKYGVQTGTDAQWFPDAGNGSNALGAILGNNPGDASTLVDSTFQQGFVQHLVGKFGGSNAGGVRYYILDNEPSLWHSTHRDVHPNGATMDEIRDKMLDYAAKVRAADANAVIVGPEEWGWSGYLYSGADQQYGQAHGWSTLPDRAAHGGQDYLPWLLSQLRSRDAASGKRSLDVFSVHYYPQGGEFSDDVSSAMQLRRNRSTRSLWDPNYVDESWIATGVKLIPRIKGWVASSYPGLKTGITEYNWGAESHINGATTQADVLGIFGREGLDLAARWTTPAAGTPTYKAMKLYRNYDGQKSTFGDTSVAATTPNPDNVSAFAAVRASDGALTVMVVSKVLTGTTPVTLSLANFAHGGLAQAWQLTSSNAITRLPDARFAGNALTVSAPAQSVTLYVFPKASSGGNGTAAGDAIFSSHFE